MRTLNEPAHVGLLARELWNVGVNVAAIQEIRWPRTGEREFRAVDLIAKTSFKYHIYYSGGDRAERGVGFIVSKFFNYSLISMILPHYPECHFPDCHHPEFHYPECTITPNSITPNAISPNLQLS